MQIGAAKHHTYLERQVSFFLRELETPKTSNYCLKDRALGNFQVKDNCGCYGKVGPARHKDGYNCYNTPLIGVITPGKPIYSGHLEGPHNSIYK